MNILLTREEQKNRELKNILQSKGHIVFDCPMIELCPISTDPCGTRSIRNMTKKSPVLITSKFACELWLDMRETYFAEAEPTYYVVVGETSAQMLQEADPNVPIKYLLNSSNELVNCDFSNIDRLLYPCSKIRRSEVFEILKAKGVQVIDFVLYENLLPKNAAKDLENLLKKNFIHVVVFYSSSAVRNFFHLYNQLFITNNKGLIDGLNMGFMSDVQIIAIGETTKYEVENYFNGKIITPTKPHKDLVLEEILKFDFNVNR